MNLSDPIFNHRYVELADYVIIDGPIEPERIHGIVFCPTNRLREFFPACARRSQSPVTLISSQLHGTPFSDYNVEDSRYKGQWTYEFETKYKFPRRRWYSKNADSNIAAPIPIGIEPDKVDSIREIVERRLEKRYTLNAVMDSTTNHGERAPALYHAQRVPHACVVDTQPYSSGGRWSFPQYAESIARSWFTLCPPGAGLDTWRMWEALYLGSIPVVKKSRMTMAFRNVHDIPMLMYDFPDEIPEVIESAPASIQPLGPEAQQLTFKYWADMICRK